MSLRPKPILFLTNNNESLQGREIHLLQDRFGPQEKVDWEIVRPPTTLGSTLQLAALCADRQIDTVICRHDYVLPFSRPPGIELLRFDYAPEQNRKGILVDYPRQTPPRRVAA